MPRIACYLVQKFWKVVVEMGTMFTHLKYNNFDSFGVDYAEDVVKKINSLVPELDIRQGDVFLISRRRPITRWILVTWSN